MNKQQVEIQKKISELINMITANITIRFKNKAELGLLSNEKAILSLSKNGFFVNYENIHSRNVSKDDSIDNLKIRFIWQKIEDFKNENIKPMPTMIFEEYAPLFAELNNHQMISGNIKPLTSLYVTTTIEERVEPGKIKDFGELYVLVNPN